MNLFHTISRYDDGLSIEARVKKLHKIEGMDEKFGFGRYKDTSEKLGWLINMHPVNQFLASRIPFCSCIHEKNNFLSFALTTFRILLLSITCFPKIFYLLKMIA